MTQNTPTIYQRLKTGRGAAKLTNTVYALKVTDIQNYDKNFEELSVSAALRAERIACQMRNLVCPALSPNQAAYLPKAADAQGMRIAEQQGILTITLPGLLPETKSPHKHCISP